MVLPNTELCGLWLVIYPSFLVWPPTKKLWNQNCVVKDLPDQCWWWWWMMMDMIEFFWTIYYIITFFYDHWNVVQGESRTVSMKSHPWTHFLGGKFNVHSDDAISIGSVHLFSTLCVSCVDQGSALTGFATGWQNDWGKGCNIESRKGQLKTAVKKSAMRLSILAYKHLRIIFYFASSVPAVAFSSLAAIPFQAILGELRDIFLRCGCWSLDFTQSGHLLAKCKHLWPITSSCKTLFRQ